MPGPAKYVNLMALKLHCMQQHHYHKAKIVRGSVDTRTYYAQVCEVNAPLSGDSTVAGGTESEGVEVSDDVGSSFH